MTGPRTPSPDLYAEPARDPVVFRCERCGQVANFGINRTPRNPGRWFCAEHRPEEHRLVPVAGKVAA